jgi:hypothetical protein
MSDAAQMADSLFDPATATTARPPQKRADRIELAGLLAKGMNSGFIEAEPGLRKTIAY